MHSPFYDFEWMACDLNMFGAHYPRKHNAIEPRHTTIQVKCSRAHSQVKQVSNCFYGLHFELFHQESAIRYGIVYGVWCFVVWCVVYDYVTLKQFPFDVGFMKWNERMTKTGSIRHGKINSSLFWFSFYCWRILKF